MTTVIIYVVIAVAIFGFGFFVGVNNAKAAQAKIDAAKAASDSVKKVINS